jgi:hypothetical protein
VVIFAQQAWSIAAGVPWKNQIPKKKGSLKAALGLRDGRNIKLLCPYDYRISDGIFRYDLFR